MSQEEVRQRWARYNVFGDGKNHSSSHGATTWYRGDTLFYYDNPSCRIFRVDGRYAALARPGSGAYTGVSTGVDKNEGKPWDLHMAVPCIGVFTHYEGDCMDADTLHKRNRWLYAKSYEAALKAMYNDRPVDFASNPDRYVDAVMKSLTRINNDRMAYSQFFVLGWDYYDPEEQRSDIALHYHESADLFNMPSAVAKRERAAARRTAKKAFGVT